MFEDEILAWKYGPVVEKKVYKKFEYGTRSIVEVTEEEINSGKFNDETAIQDFKELNGIKEVVDILETVQKYYANYSAIELMNKTHSENPWKETKQNEAISIDAIKKYFKESIIDV